MTVSTMANVVQTLQSDIINILKADTTSLTFNVDGETVSQTSTLSEMKIVDGIPTDMIRGVGFPYIIVHTPDVNETRLTMTKHRSEMTVHIEIVDRREGNVRILTDAVKNALQDSQSTTQGHGYWWYGRNVRSSINSTWLPNEGEKAKPAWHMNLFFTYLWTGS